MTHRLSQFAEAAGFTVLRDGAFELTGKLSTPLTGLCVPLRAAKYADEVNSNPRVAAVITTAGIAEALDARFAVALAEQPDVAHAELHACLAKLHEAAMRARPNKIDSSAVIDSSARIADHGVEIGANVRIGAHVTLAPGVSVEENCVLHPGVSLGVPGFNSGLIGGRQRIIPQLGGVRLRPWVELLSNVCVARALFGGETTLGEETLADNLVYIAHDVQIGRRVQICAHANILGRVEIGDGAYIGPSAVIVNGARIGEKAKVSLGAVVTRDVPAGAVVTGNFAVPHDRFLSHLRRIR
ncbi:DapH/DapD/GlmU-related protein [Brevundimonas sp.]|uniref:DapH/DapD/GlmU-related protein n=1 Tax=Brevundimonas sp. TaxID=1871086 RepID=UPI002D3574B4|nr:DapH/DapD/GlmU-related protein [Brevundimonas sp.]HYC67392.1 DapH/DapD/GlmU-related protein [Brevundimonas sp.]